MVAATNQEQRLDAVYVAPDDSEDLPNLPGKSAMVSNPSLISANHT
jgi:hypothetical protein